MGVAVTFLASDSPSINQSATIKRAGSTACRDVDISQEITGPVAERSSWGHYFSFLIRVSSTVKSVLKFRKTETHSLKSFFNLVALQ